MNRYQQYYQFDSKIEASLSFLHEIIQQISAENTVSIQKSRGKDEWISSADDQFKKKLKILLTPEDKFIFGENQISFRFKFSYEGKLIALVAVCEVWNLLKVVVVSEKAFDHTKFLGNLKTRLNLQEASDAEVDESFSSTPELNRKLLEVDRKLSKLIPAKRLVERVFLSMRFDDHSKSIAFDLEKFFRLLNIVLVTGMGVEPRSVSEKVQSRMSSEIDLFLVLFTESGSSDWVNQEIGFAKAKKYPTLVLKEKAMKGYKAGMLNDNEYIDFGLISEAHIGILETIRYIENQPNYSLGDIKI